MEKHLTKFYPKNGTEITQGDHSLVLFYALHSVTLILSGCFYILCADMGATANLTNHLELANYIDFLLIKSFCQKVDRTDIFIKRKCKLGSFLKSRTPNR